MIDIDIGNQVYDLDPLMKEVSVSFSSDCRYLVACDDYALKFYMLDDYFLSKARKIFDFMHADPLIW